MKTILIFLMPVLAFGATGPGTGVAPDKVYTFDKPDPARAFAECKVLSPDGAVWRKPVEDWAGARRRVADDPAWARWLAAQQTELDEWMARHHDRPDWVAGWWHDAVSPKDGSFLTWTPAVPGEEVKFFSSHSDPHVEITPKIFNAWVMIFRSRNMVMMQRAARLWRMTGDPRYADWLAGQLDFYAKNLNGWPIQDRFYGPSRLFGQPLDEAVCLMELTDAARLIWDRTPPAQRQFWIDDFFRPEAELMNQSMRRYQNIACWLRGASAQVALLCGDEALWRSTVDGPYGIRDELEHGVTSDYIWYEQSMGYNEYVVQALTPFFIAAAMHDRGPEIAREMEIGENLFLAPALLRFPNGVLPSPADANYQRYVPMTNVLLGAYRVLPTPRGLAQARKTRSWDTLIDPPSGPPVAIPPLPAVTTRNFESTRFAVLQSGGWQVFFQYGQLTVSHAQAAALTFEAFYGDTDVSHEACTVGYGSPLHKGYYQRGLNHNVPLLNGAGGEPAHAGTLLSFDAAKASVAAAQPEYRTDARASRSLRVAGHRLIDETEITAVAGTPQLLGLALHVQGHVALPAAFLPTADFAAGRDSSFAYWTDVRSAVYRDHASFDVTYPSGLVLSVAFSVPGEFRVFHGSAPDSPPPAGSEGFYIETRGTKTVFRTEFTPKSQNL